MASPTHRTEFHERTNGRIVIAAPHAEQGGAINIYGGQNAGNGTAPTTHYSLSVATQLTSLTFIEDTTRRCEPFSTVPFSRDPDFVDRPDILEWIHEKCAQPAARAGLVGLGGVVIEYSHCVRRTSPQTWVFWVNGSTKARFEEAYGGIADRLKLPGRHDPKINVLQLVRNWLCDEANGRWMMVLDNADNVEVFYPQPSHNQEPTRPLAAYLPQSHNGSILVTSRNRDTAARLTGGYKNVKEVQAMGPGQALQLLRNKLEDSFNEEGATDLLDDLNHIPLAITQAAAYINRQGPRTTISSYLDEFRENDRNRANLLNIDACDFRRDETASNSVILTWQISFRRIREERHSAADLLSLMSFFNPQGIPECVLRSYVRKAAEMDGKYKPSVWLNRNLTALRRSFRGNSRKREEDAKDGFDDDLDTLRAYSLATATAEREMWEMHPLVQFCTRVWLSSAGDVEKWKRRFYILMSSEFPSGIFENWSKCQQLLPHVEPLFGTGPIDDGLVDEWAGMLTKVAWYMWMKGSYKVAEDTVVKAVIARARALGRRNINTLNSESLLALVLQHQGKYEEAERICRRILKGYKRALGKEHLDTLGTISNLAAVLNDQGKFEEAEKMNRQALERYEKALGREHPCALRNANNLAITLRDLGKYKEAEEMHRQTLERGEKVLGKGHPYILGSINNLALGLQDLGKYKEAEEMHRQALEGYEKVLGKEHPGTLMRTNNLALVLRDLGKYKEAEKMHRQTLERSEKVLGEGHPSTLMSINNLALVLQNLGKYKEAEQMARRGLEGKEKVLGNEHPSTLASVNNLSMVLQNQGKYEEAEQMARRGLEGREKALGNEHPDTLVSVNTLTSILRCQEKCEEAEQMARRGLQGRQKVLGNEHPSTLESVYCLAHLHHKQKRYDTASELYRRACDAYEKVLGPQHPTTVACCNDFARMADEINQSLR
ncbi:hypothetical protein GP486_003180 [Trichoglossum hirsutum]|uniref:TPR-like protein n=1 Tax=Trichoglossum hirsutum TaxID=265104 RepID=A0A9P8LDR9_9PEZI|nr:hypothetical protein GP486_003180 [Trichoglossum hirsutum]